jgi:hypothetical protein
MLRALILGTGLFLWAHAAQGQSVLLNTFNLLPDGADILLEWELQSESGITEFQIFRRFQDEALPVHLYTLAPDGRMRYQYLDDNIFKTESRVVHYELHVVTPGKVHKFSRSLSHNPTSIQRTWGSIKSMFR